MKREDKKGRRQRASGLSIPSAGRTRNEALPRAPSRRRTSNLSIPSAGRTRNEAPTDEICCQMNKDFQYPLRVVPGMKPRLIFQKIKPGSPFQYPLRVVPGMKPRRHDATSLDSVDFQYPLRVVPGMKRGLAAGRISQRLNFQYPLRVVPGMKQVIPHMDWQITHPFNTLCGSYQE